MKFGRVKTIIENNLSESVKDKKIFKENIKNFKKHILKDKNLSKLYVLYGDLSKPRGLTESEAKTYLDEGIDWAKKLISKSKIPVILNKLDNNEYGNIDKLVYESTKSIEELVEIKKNILTVLVQPIKINENKINLPISSMVKVVNTKVNEYINSLNEETKKEILSLLKEDKNKLNADFITLKSDTEKKLFELSLTETNAEVKEKILKAIDKVKTDKFDILNYYEIKNLNKSLNG
jgi:hypothetical protein